VDKQLGVEGSRQSTEKTPVNILVVEDNASNFFLISRLLESHGFHCEWKTSGFEVVEFADTLPGIDLILLDIMLPYEDGYSAFKKIRQSPKLTNIPIIAVTALSNEKELNKAKITGFNGFIGKPLNPDKFHLQVKKVLSGESVWELNK
jgi:two-component system cell cycle response regulator DivK